MKLGTKVRKKSEKWEGKENNLLPLLYFYLFIVKKAAQPHRHWGHGCE